MRFMIAASFWKTCFGKSKWKKKVKFRGTRLDKICFQVEELGMIKEPKINVKKGVGGGGGGRDRECAGADTIDLEA